MRTQKLRIALPLAVLFTLATACGDDSTGPDDGELPSGSLSFSYDGAVSGTFSVSGAARLDANGEPEFGTWAVGGRDAATNNLAIAAFRARTAPSGDLFSFFMPSVTGPGTVAICDFLEADCEIAAALVFDLNLETDIDVSDRFCVLNAGEIEVTTLRADRAVGSFSGMGICFTNASTSPDVITISSGSFNVPLTDEFGVDGL